MAMAPNSMACGVPGTQTLVLRWLVLAFLGASPAQSQFGGGSYTPPAPICKPFKCPAGQKAVGKPETKVWSYGCKESGANIFSMANLDPNNPLAGMQNQRTVNKCCLERDICKQTCGTTSKECHDAYQSCTKKICKGDQNCMLGAMMADITSDPSDTDYTSKDYKYDPEAQKCKAYDRGQNDACQCVPKDDVKKANEEKLAQFYKKYNPEKLNKDGKIKDVAEVWKKWKGKEPAMFVALSTKYKDKVVEMREKPKRPPPPPTDTSSDEAGSTGDDAGEPEEEATPEPTTATSSSEDEEEKAFTEKLSELEAKKKKASADEDYDLAQSLKEEAAKHKTAEITRLKAKKSVAIENEEYVEAKKIKDRIAKLEL